MVFPRSLNLSEQLEQSHGKFRVKSCMIFVWMVKHEKEVVVVALVVFSLRISSCMRKNSLCIYI